MSNTKTTSGAAYDGTRYQVRSYKLRGVEFFRVDDTFNGGRAIAKGFTRESDAVTRRDVLNQFQTAREPKHTAHVFAQESIQTPTAASAAAALVSAACFNDEIRAIVARELLRRIVRPNDEAIAVQLATAQEASSLLVTAFDRQYRD